MKSRPLGMPVKPSRGHNYACNCIFCFLFFLHATIDTGYAPAARGERAR